MNTVAWKWICCSNVNSHITWFKSTRHVVCWSLYRGYHSGWIKVLYQLVYHLVSLHSWQWQHKLRVLMPHYPQYHTQKPLMYGREFAWHSSLERCWSLRSSIMHHVQVSSKYSTKIYIRNKSYRLWDWCTFLVHYSQRAFQ